MIDASAGDLWNGEGYRLGITDGRVRTEREFVRLLDLDRPRVPAPVPRGPLPRKGLFRLAGPDDVPVGDASLIGDNLYSSDETRIREGAANCYANGAVIKPNQAGTVTAVARALRAAARFRAARDHFAPVDQHGIDFPVPADLRARCAEVIKIGPLATDFSSVVRLNELIRLTEDGNAG